MRSVAAWVIAALLGLGLGSLPFVHFAVGHVGHSHSVAHTHSVVPTNSAPHAH